MSDLARVDVMLDLLRAAELRAARVEAELNLARQALATFMQERESLRLALGTARAELESARATCARGNGNERN